MITVAGIFNSYVDASRAAENLRSAGISEDRINLLAPGTGLDELEKDVPTTETEQPGMGKALGGAVGGALGVAGGLHMGAAAASLFVPGVGPILAAGIAGAALLGLGGAATGAMAGDKIEDSFGEGVPHDELYVYEDALRRGRSVVIAFAEDDTQKDAAREVLSQSGAESLDAARDEWWVGLRDAEQEEYAREGGDFGADEASFRQGFEASLHPKVRGRSYDEARERLQERHGEACTAEAFRRGYARGCAYHRQMQEKYKA
ncbi:MAG TPA: hypothetical protein VJS44_21730 [Pyrinomonadaceae bacterium]|nr:hypothetical protein [Pyrinomonadaceae bacterium]